MAHKKTMAVNSTKSATPRASWEDTCNAQGWDEETQIIHLEGFIAQKKLTEKLAAYAVLVAQEENEDTSLVL